MRTIPFLVPWGQPTPSEPRSRRSCQLTQAACVDVLVGGSPQQSCVKVFETPHTLGWEGITIFAVHGYTRTAESTVSTT